LRVGAAFFLAAGLEDFFTAMPVLFSQWIEWFKLVSLIRNSAESRSAAVCSAGSCLKS
jgi:hypothetical protein